MLASDLQTALSGIARSVSTVNVDLNHNLYAQRDFFQHVEHYIVVCNSNNSADVIKKVGCVAFLYLCIWCQ